MNPRVRITLLLVAALIARLPAIAASDAGAGAKASPEAGSSSPRIGRKIETFELTDLAGNRRSLDDWSKSRLVVVVFLGVECPLMPKYAPRLNELSEQYARQGVTLIGVNSNYHDTREEIAAFVKQQQISFPILKDHDNVVADLFSAERTPEVYVLDQDRRVRYAGRIDDQFGVGYRRLKITDDYLSDAVEDLLAGKAVRRPAVVAVGCHIARKVLAGDDAPVTWSNQVSRIVQHRCQQCHRPGNIGPFSLLTYEDASPWFQTIGEVVERGSMPPWHGSPLYGKFSNDGRLSDEEKSLVAKWVADGAPEGDPAQLPPAKQFTGGWPIGEPDEIIYMTKEPFQVPAGGGALYRYFFVDPGFKEDRWVVLSWCEPGNRAVVHHVNVYFRPPWQDWNQWLGGTVNLISGFLPGQQPPPETPRDMALYVPAGSELVFEMHYTPNGKPQTDRTAVGLVYLDPKQVNREIMHVCAYNDKFAIPPYHPYYKVEADYTFNEDARIDFLCPHLHMRGKDFIYDAHYPDGRRETLLEIKNYDYEWQTMYYLADPKPMPKGTRIHCTCYYDNSPANIRNPDPSATVRWSGYTTDEMMVGVIGMSRLIDTTRYVSGQTLPNGRPIPPTRAISAGNAAIDRGKFLEGKGDARGAAIQYVNAFKDFGRSGDMVGIARTVRAEIRLGLGRFWKRLLAYLLTINLVALLVREFRLHRNRQSGQPLRRWPALLLVALGGIVILVPRLRNGRSYRTEPVAEKQPEIAGV